MSKKPPPPIIYRLKINLSKNKFIMANPRFQGDLLLYEQFCIKYENGQKKNMTRLKLLKHLSRETENIIFLNMELFNRKTNTYKNNKFIAIREEPEISIHGV